MLEVLVNRHCPRSRFLRGATRDGRKLHDALGAQGQRSSNRCGIAPGGAVIRGDFAPGLADADEVLCQRDAAARRADD